MPWGPYRLFEDCPLSKSRNKDVRDIERETGKPILCSTDLPVEELPLARVKTPAPPKKLQTYVGQ